MTMVFLMYLFKRMMWHFKNEMCNPDIAYTIKIERRKQKKNRNDRDTHVTSFPSKLLFKIAQKSHVILNVNHILIVYSVHLLSIFGITICRACAKACSSGSVLSSPFDCAFNHTHTTIVRTRTHVVQRVSSQCCFWCCSWCCMKFAIAYWVRCRDHPVKQTWIHRHEKSSI